LGKTTLPLAGGGVDVWTVALDAAPAVRERLRASLAPDELHRAARFLAARDADRYVVGRGALRAVLAGYLDTAPRALRFRYGPQGKPELEDSAGGLHFNVAHADALALIAVTGAAPIGVDVEAITTGDDLDTVAATHFAAEERRELAALGSAEQAAAFLRIWTRKEAWLKATGDGLAVPLGSFAVTQAPDAPRLLHIGGDAGAAATWTLLHLEPGPGYVAAIAAPAPISATLRRWDPAG
jgi:4'-phosphopantetheinyl transferase